MRMRIPFVAATVLPLLIGTGCADSTSEIPEPAAATGSHGYGAPPPAEVAFQERGHGWLMTDAKGMALYTFSADQEPGKSACNDRCAQMWPPLKAPEAVDGDGDWSTIVRQDGTHQWAFQDKPLYTYSRDRAPGDTNGDGVNDQWALALKPIPMPPGFDILRTAYGVLLVDDRGMALYTSEDDPVGKSECGQPCIWTWQPVEAPWTAQPPDANWSLIAREDGTRQWAYNGRALYRYSEDFVSGEIAGDGMEGREAVVLDPPPPVPDWVTVHKSDGGEIYADPEGRTLYAHDTTGRAGLMGGRGIQRPMDWIPVSATPADKPVGQWTIVENEDGKLQWAFKGLLLYINVRDKEPGQLNGVRSIDRVWRPLLTNGKTMPGTGA